MAEHVDEGEPMRVSNEFTSIEVRKVATRNGELLELRSRTLGFVVRLDPLELESLTWQPASVFSRLLETPYGPEHDTATHPLSDLLVLEPAGPDDPLGNTPGSP
ncbi:MAG: dihydrodiol dehydrogenase [Actinomycetota bacterium]|nr:dihydrodiol dehydrogenase [Actinomycetota bacterium]